MRRVPEVVVKRLPVYLRVLEDLAEDGVDLVSSSELSSRTGHSSEQIRKDLAHFGAFGTRGVGYRVQQLAKRIERILGLDRERQVVLVGAGNLGTALARHLLGRPGRVRLVGVFDKDIHRIGVDIGGLQVRSADELSNALVELGARIAIIAVTPTEAQGVADRLTAGGVQSILNFSPVKLTSTGAHIRNIDIMLELQSMSFYASNHHPRSGN